MYTLHGSRVPEFGLRRSVRVVVAQLLVRTGLGSVPCRGGQGGQCGDGLHRRCWGIGRATKLGPGRVSCGSGSSGSAGVTADGSRPNEPHRLAL